jgi:hypothetical protein
VAVNPDFRDLLAALSAEGAEFLIVGGYAVMFFTEPRYTKDIDVWVRPTRENGAKVLAAIKKFGGPSFGMTPAKLAHPGWILQLGVPPNRIDILNDLKGLDFESAWKNRVPTTFGGVKVFMLGLDDLVRNKTAVGRPMDLIDVAGLKLAKRLRRKRRNR